MRQYCRVLGRVADCDCSLGCGEGVSDLPQVEMEEGAVTKDLTQLEDLSPWARAELRQRAMKERAARARQKVECRHDWRKTEDWLIDRCARCGEERA